MFFVRNTKRCHKLKLFKLLSFLDFEHYRQTGGTVTGLLYDAWPRGPVPSDLDKEFERSGLDLAAAVSIFKARPPSKMRPTIDDYTEYTEIDYRSMKPEPEPETRERFEFRPKKQFDFKYFTKREMRIMETIAEIYRYASGYDMTEVSHLKDQPWSLVYNRGEGSGRLIPYALALSSRPIIEDAPTIESDELAYREEALREVKQHTGT